MKRIFGQKKEKAPAPTLDQAADKLTSRADALDEKIRKLDEELLRHKDKISKTRGPAQAAAKQRALVVLRQKKLYESQRDQLAGQQVNVDQTAFNMQSMQDSVQVVQALTAAVKETKQTLKKHKELRPENLDKLYDDLADMNEQHQEMQELMGYNYGVPEIDEDDLAAELEGLDDELAAEAETGEGLPAYLAEPELPAAPQAAAEGSAPAAAERDEFGLPAAVSGGR